MGGHFTFALTDRARFNAERYKDAIKEIRKIKAPKEVYTSFGPEDMGVYMILKVQHRAEWTLILPVNPLKDTIENGLTYGVVSRTAVWNYIKAALSVICQKLPYAFEFSYTDEDLGDCKEVGFYDYQQEKFVVQHSGLPSTAHLQHP